MDRERLYRQFVAEEVASALRHRVVNKVAAVGALNFHLRRQIEAIALPSAITSVPPLIDAEVAQASASLDIHFVAPPGPPRATAVRAALGAASERLGRPLELAGSAAVSVSIDPDELELALFCLLENALEAAAMVMVSAASASPHGVIDVIDDGPGLPERATDPFFTTKPGRLGLGLNVAARIVQRWGGALELRPRERAPGLQARVLLPEAS
jgi:signal transduction histidine kinase